MAHNIPPQAANTSRQGNNPQTSNYSIKSSTPGTPVRTRVNDIASLTPNQNRWQIRARVTQKSGIRTWNKNNREGTVFSVDLLDESGEIRAAGFNDAVDKYYKMLEVNKIYFISKGTLEKADKRYNNLSNNYEIKFNADTTVELCTEEVDLPSVKFNFTKINDLSSKTSGDIVDLIGVVKSCGDVGTVTVKASLKTKRDLQLCDQSDMVVIVTLWGNDAQSFEGSSNPVFAVKGAKFSDYRGRHSASVLHNSLISINPDIREAHLLREWFDREEQPLDIQSSGSEGGMGGGAINSGGTDLLTESIPTELQVSNSHSAEPVMLENSSVMSQVTNNESTNVQTDAFLDLNPATDSQEPAMPVTEYVSSFKGFSDVYPSCKRLTHKLARLFAKFDKEETHHLTISFKEATERLRTAVENSLCNVEIITGKKVSEFRIGKSSVTSQENTPFDPMEPMTWGEVGGTNGKWREHKEDNYDGLIEVGCVTNELIPKVIKEVNTTIRMDHQMYALGMAQALVHHYMVHEPDRRLRNKSFDIGNWSEGERGDEGGIIYIAYKLESENILEVQDGSVIEEEEQDVRTIELLRIKLEEEGLHFRGSIPDDGNSFFKACSDQLKHLEIPGCTHTELRQMVIPNLKLCSEEEIKSADFTRDTWNRYIDTVAKDKENVEDIVVETMAKLLRKQIIVYSRSNTNRISFNEEPNETPLLLAKDKLYYQSLERRHDGTPSRLQKSNTSKRAASPALLDDNASPSKLRRMPQEDQ